MAYKLGKWVITFLVLLSKHNGLSFRCDRKPYGITTQSSPADGRFHLKVAGGHTAYLPDQLYTIEIVSTDGISTFTGFMISAEGDLKPDPRNPRRMISQYPGDIRPLSENTAKISVRCFYSVEQVISNRKESIEVGWKAPPPGSGCVTIRAMVAENDNVWFEDGGPLTMKICEDTRQPDDLALQLNEDCQVCDEAKYEISFTGIWSRNTHHRYYPENDWLTRYSDLVGASHTSEYILWSPGTKATDGLRQLAEHANSSALEREVLEKIGDGARTLIKAKGHSDLKMNMPSYAFFRSDKINHMISVAVAISPSPDWFLGVARFELCQTNNSWLQKRELNLFPWDAGTDSGVSYESPNIETFPQDAITRVQMSSYDKNSPFYETDIKDLHPFGRLEIKLVRTYPRQCEGTSESEGGESPTAEEEVNGDEDQSSESKSSEPEEPSRYQNPDLDSSEIGGPDSYPKHYIQREPEEPAKVEEETSEDCHMPKWQDWSVCEGICENGMVKGLRWRVRNHLPVHHHKEVSNYCKNKYETFQNEECEEACSEPEKNENNVNAEKRTMPGPVLPGQPWSKKRDTKENII